MIQTNARVITTPKGRTLLAWTDPQTRQLRIRSYPATDTPADWREGRGQSYRRALDPIQGAAAWTRGSR